MANITKLRLKGAVPDSIMKKDYYTPTKYKCLFTGWEVNRGCVVQISKDGTTLTIRKFNPKTWCIRSTIDSMALMNKTSWENFAVPWYLNIQGLENVLTNLNTSTNDAGTTAFPGTHRISPSGDRNSYYYVKGFSLQPYDSYWKEELMRQYPWDMGIAGLDSYGGRPYKDWGAGGSNLGFIKDGDKKRVISNSSMYYSGSNLLASIGIYGYFNNTISEGGEEYVDISDTPIIITAYNEWEDGVDVSTVEAWDIYMKDTLVWHKEKTIENCWIKYNLAHRDKNYIVVDGAAAKDIPLGIHLPEVIDLEENITKIKWDISIKNTSLWEKVRPLINNTTLTADWINRASLSNSNISGDITINVSEVNSTGGPNQFLAAPSRNNKFGNVENVNLVSQNGCVFSVGQHFFRAAKNLKTVTCSSPRGYFFGGYDCSGMFEGCASLESFSSNLINYGSRNPNNKFTTHIPWMFSGCSKLIEVPSYTDNREDGNNTIVLTDISCQAFEGCSSLTKIGPILDFKYVDPQSTSGNSNGDAYKTFDCPLLTDVRIKNLNHGTWRFDNSACTKVEGDMTSYHGYLPSLNAESIIYLLSNLTDLTKEVIDEGIYTSNPKRKTASLYCPTEWRALIPIELISEAASKGWSIHMW